MQETAIWQLKHIIKQKHSVLNYVSFVDTHEYPDILLCFVILYQLSKPINF